MRWGLTLSAILHIAMALFVYFGVPSLFEAELVIDEPIVVEIYTIAEVTTPPPPPPAPELEQVAEAEPEPPPPEPEPPPPEPEPEPPPPPPEPEPPPPPPEPEPPPPPPEPEPPPPPPPPEPEPEPPPPPPEPEPEPEPEPPPPPPEPVEAPPPPPPPKPVRIAKAKPAPEPKVEPKPEPKPEPPAMRQPFASLLKNLAATPAKPRPKARPKPAAKPVAPVAAVRQRPLSLSVAAAIRRQVEENWNVPVGARNANKLVVEIRIVLLSDGSVADARIVDRGRLNRAGEEFFRTMAESAVRAVWRASPIRGLPPKQYDQWREITFKFIPPV